MRLRAPPRACLRPQRYTRTTRSTRWERGLTGKRGADKPEVLRVVEVGRAVAPTEVHRRLDRMSEHRQTDAGEHAGGE